MVAGKYNLSHEFKSERFVAPPPQQPAADGAAAPAQDPGYGAVAKTPQWSCDVLTASGPSPLQVLSSEVELKGVEENSAVVCVADYREAPAAKPSFNVGE